MYLKKNRVNGRSHLIIAHGYRDQQTKKVRTKTIKTLGYLDELEKQYPDPITHFKQMVAKMNQDAAAEKDLCSVKIDPDCMLSTDMRRNIG